MIGDIEDQERRDALAFRHMCHGREIKMLRRIVAEFLTVTKLRLRLMMDSATCFCSLDDRWHVVGVAIDRHAAFDTGQRQPLRLEISIIGADQCGELCTGRMAHDEDSIRIAPVLGNVIMHPVHRLGDVAKIVPISTSGSSL